LLLYPFCKDASSINRIKIEGLLSSLYYYPSPTATMENVLAARQAADKAGLKCDKMAIYVAQMQGYANYYINELKLCKEEKKAEAEANVVKHNKALADAHAEWSAALGSQGELWQTYCDLFDEHQKKEQEQVQEDRPDEKCTFCDEMYSECGGDHGDEMRQIIRESGGWE